MLRKAVFSKNKLYRYKLIRSWDEGKAKIVFVMLNPSTADHIQDDPTITRCISFAKSWGFGSLDILNLFAYRTPYPDLLYQAADPVGPRNMYHLKNTMNENVTVVCAWGNIKSYKEQELIFLKKFADKDLYCIKQNKSGSPAHPLYLKANLKLKKLRFNF